MVGKFLFVFLILLPIIIFSVLILGAFSSTKSKLAKSKTDAFAEYDISKGDFAIKSLSFRYKGDIPKEYTCDGKNISPILRFYNVPSGTHSLVLTVTDPNTRFGRFTHWVVWNIDPAIGVIKNSKLPKNAVQGVNSYNKNQYDGPCPPYGEEHEYFFNVFALDTKLDISEYSTLEDIEPIMKDNIIGTFGIVGRYAR